MLISHFNKLQLLHCLISVSEELKYLVLVCYDGDCGASLTAEVQGLSAAPFSLPEQIRHALVETPQLLPPIFILQHYLKLVNANNKALLRLS